MDPEEVHSNQTDVMGCLWKGFLFFVSVAVIMLFGLGIMIGIVIASGL